MTESKLAVKMIEVEMLKLIEQLEAGQNELPILQETQRRLHQM